MHKHIFLSIISFIVIGQLSVFAQDEIPNISYSGTPKKYEIADITVTGIQNYDPSILINLSGLRVGQTIQIPGDDITQSIKKYWEHGLFSDVKILASKIEDRRIFLEIKLTERPRLSEIIYYGLKKSEKEDIAEKVAMMKGSQVTPYLVTRAEKYIKDHFVEKGFYNTEVKIFQRNDTTGSNQVVLEITVDKQDKVKVNRMTILGNEVISNFDVKWAMKKTNEQGRIYNFFRTKKFVVEKYEEDKAAVITKYNKEGYRDAYIVYDSITRNDNNTVDIRMKIDEGHKYYFGNITWVGNSIYPGEFLSQELRIKKGEVFNQSELEERLTTADDAVHNWYMNNGYLFSNITPTEISVVGDTIDLEMRIYEGPQATVNNVIIKGNTKTHEHVVRREVRTKPGQLFSKAELIRTVRELAQLGHFDPEKISPDVQPNQSDGTVDLIYSLEEKANDQVELSGGWGAGMFVGSLGLKFTNFSVRNVFNGEAWRPLPTGDGQTLSLRAQTNGSYYQTYSASFTEPWLGGKKPTSLSLSVYFSKQTNMSAASRNGYSGYGNNNQYAQQGDPNTFMKIFGSSIGYGKRLTWPDDYFQIYTELAYQFYSLQNWQSFIMSNGNSNNLNLGVTLTRNSVDNPLYTRSGSTFSVSTHITPPYSMFSDKNYKQLSDNIANSNNPSVISANERELYQYIEYHKWNFKGSIFKPMDKQQKLVLMGKVEAGFLGYYNQYARSPFEKFVVGGDGMSGFSMYGSETIGLRGYENSSLTPQSLNKATGRNAYDGNMYTKMGLELRYPITLEPSATVYALTFIESGNSWKDFNDYNPFLMYRSAGVGLRIFLPIFGLMGIDWAYGFDQVPGYNNAGGSQFHFVIGQSF